MAPRKWEKPVMMEIPKMEMLACLTVAWFLAIYVLMICLLCVWTILDMSVKMYRWMQRSMIIKYNAQLNVMGPEEMGYVEMASFRTQTLITVLKSVMMAMRTTTMIAIITVENLCAEIKESRVQKKSVMMGRRAQILDFPARMLVAIAMLIFLVSNVKQINAIITVRRHFVGTEQYKLQILILSMRLVIMELRTQILLPMHVEKIVVILRVVMVLRMIQ
jgi:hypothetical protein